MAGYLNLNFQIINFFHLYLFLLINNVFFASSSILLYPKSQRYRTVNLMDPIIYHAKHPLRLSSGLNSAIIIETDNSNINKTNDLFCKFIIKVPKGEHLFAVVQSLSFRRDDHGCIDYIEFRRKGEIEADQRICGKINQPRFETLNHDNNDDNYDDIYQYSSRYDESDLDGEIETTIFVSKKSLLMNEYLNLTIAYTPYKDCDKVDHNDYESTTAYNICLWKEYFCDGVQNCASDLCADEQYCSNVFGNGNGTKLTIGAIVTIILCLLKFLASLWICKRYKIFCWSPDMEPTVNNINNTTSTNIEGDIDSFGNNQSPSVPPLHVSVLPSSHDKDLPPSYESLFPERVTP